MHAVQNILSERRLLEQIEHPNIVNLRYAFQDDENMFMVLDVMLGGDLRFHLDRSGYFREDEVRFIVAELSLAIHYLHEHNIVHRDIKPDNILFDDKGHTHLTDFNIALKCRQSSPMYTVAGSIAYMAPEVVTKKGYDKAIDWWSLGATTYELLFGRRPFRGNSNDSISKAIAYEDLKFPDNAYDVLSNECIDFITKLMCKNPADRLGVSTEGYAQLISHPWFRDIDWKQIEQQTAEPPFSPDPKRANFDVVHELEELLLEDTPLKTRRRKKQPTDTNNSSQHRSFSQQWTADQCRDLLNMEKKFQDYDFTKQRNVNEVRLGTQPSGANGISGNLGHARGRSLDGMPTPTAAVKLEDQTDNNSTPVDDVQLDALKYY
ncbi:hypothetical protein VKS41_004730 [Umbelopsis sp. WA50703]